jgi:Asp-tRNA(Asn)/Glu-tRNA(Gln) amidotransferase A subunit family amidase
MPEPRELTIANARERMREGELKAQDLVASCLERICQRDGNIHAWVEVYEEQALDQAKKCDEAVRTGKSIGGLHGIPLGVKDIIDVKGLWTRAGCSVYSPRVAEADSAAVKKLRAAGAIILGKTVTTAFANNDPAETRNPWNPKHTPGGSSSGSGAAVADRMCLAALGTQTGGSVLRPSAYNGIVGFKPTHDAISVESVIPVSRTLDHVGTHARSVNDSRILFGILREDRPERFAAMVKGAGRHEKDPASPPFKFGYFRKFVEEKAEPEIIKHIASVGKLLTQAGAKIVALDLTQAFEEATDAHRIIMDTELAAYHRTLFKLKQNQYPPNIKARIEKGLTIAGHEYFEAIRRRSAFQNELSASLSKVDAAILPAAPSTAPRGLESTGSAVFCVPWSIAGFPTITIPSGLDHQGLPLAIQIGCVPMAEEKLFTLAAWCEDQLSFTAGPV